MPDDKPMDFVPAWYRSAQECAPDSEFDHHHTHPLSDSTLEMLGLVIIFTGALFGVIGAGLLVWWLA